MSDLWRKVRDKDQASFEAIQAKVGDTTPLGETGDIEALLSKCQLLAHLPVGVDPSVATFISEAEKIIADACRDFVATADLSDHEHLVRVLARRPQGKPRTRIFTTNYDLCIERAAGNSGAHIVDGFGRESTPVFDGINFDIDFVRRRIESKSPEYLDGVVHLAKLHGSVDWATEDNRIVRREKPAAPVLIYPRSDKFELSYRQPFLEMMSQLQSALRQPNIGLLVLGFGFADAHLSEMILSAIKRNLSMKVVVATLHCEQHCNDANNWAYRPKIHLMQKLLSQGDSRIALVDATFPDLVRLVPDLGTETEEDKLRAMLRKLIT
ncbi:SIR2 family protein [Novilysobacter luteus]|nr:SIR2 family protein [Lysobacter luteus]